MPMTEFKHNFSRGVLVRLVIVLVIAALVFALSADFIANVYLRNQLTYVGWIINGGILALFFLGLGRIVAALVRYGREERALAEFVDAWKEDSFRPAAHVDRRSIIARRFEAILGLSRVKAPINHSALAATLVARESTAISLPKFVNNILILTGVFGTIVSLSIALIGASNILGDAQQPGSMGMVIHGMSTALSTTITAIVCYLVYGYFYLKLTDAQTQVLSDVEQVTTLYLMPRYAHSPDNLMERVYGLVQGLTEVTEMMRTAQADYLEAGTQLQGLLSILNHRTKPMSEDIRSIKQILREGFRLPGPEEH